MQAYLCKDAPIVSPAGGLDVESVDDLDHNDSGSLEIDKTVTKNDTILSIVW